MERIRIFRAGQDFPANGYLMSSETLRRLLASCEAEFALFYLTEAPVMLGLHAEERFLQVADDSRAGWFYADYYEEDQAHPLIDCQEGSLRDDFQFGPLILVRTAAWRDALSGTPDASYTYAAFYSLRLAISRLWGVEHLSEYLYTVREIDRRTTGEKLFDYVDPRNRAVQLEMEQACTAHLKAIGAYLPPVFRELPDEASASFPVEMSVVIPVRNRVRTIDDALASALSQQTPFPFNVIVVDNHSTDGTSEKLAACAARDARLVVVRPERSDLGIGGCWNLAIHHPQCGRYAVQLDSDDVYSSPDTLRKIAETFQRESCAMVVGTYRMTNFRMEEIPPGIIDHREWTDENGRNNALRVNGLGAPRAFRVSLLRRINFPNTSYGEDYAVGLRLSRDYRIGRIYDVLYLCRRWEDNSDAALSVEQMNRYNAYKDKLRSWELKARKQKNRAEQPSANERR